MVAFVQSPGPFRDLLICVPKSPNGERLIEGLPQGTIVATPNVVEKPRCLHFSGMAILAEKIVDSTHEVDRLLSTGLVSFGDLLVGHGSFSAVTQIGRSIYVNTDRTGYTTLFILQTENILAISNRFHGLVSLMRNLEIRRLPHYATIANIVGTTDGIFDNTFSRNTFVRQITLVDMDQYIEVTAGELSVHKTEAVARAFQGGPLSDSAYRSMLEDGVAEVLSNIKVISSSERFSNRRIGLTGGRDSRNIYAALLRAGVLDRYEMDTYAPTQESYSVDLATSVKLTSLFGGTYWKDDRRERFPISGLGALAAMISFQAGENYSIATNTWPSLGQANHCLKLILEKCNAHKTSA
jgi:hypothetical protein